MANVVIPKLRLGPETYSVSASATGGASVDGGRLVEFDGTTGTVKLAVADSTKWLGVALYGGQPTFDPATVDAYGRPGINYAVERPEIAVAYVGTYKLTATNAVLAQGDLVYCGAGGLIQKATTTGRQVGIVTNPGGIAANGSGYVRLF